MFRKILFLLIFCVSFPLSAIAAEIPDSAKIDYNQGIDYYKLGMYERAIESFRSAIREYPDYLDAYYNLGTILEYLKNYSEAITVFKQMYIRNPNDYEIISKLANLSLKNEDYEAAERYAKLIPQTAQYNDVSQKILNDITKKTKVPEKMLIPQSNIATETGVYENLSSPTGITADKRGNLYVATFSDNSIIKITPENKRTLFLKNSMISGPISMVTDNNDNIYLSNYNANNVLKITPQGTVTVLVDKLNKPYGLYVDGNMLFITCQGSNSVYRKKLSE